MPALGHYLVPFGREPGGYLDVLGVLPDATPAEVGNKDAAHRLRLRAQVRKLAKSLREQLAAGKITMEELDAENDRLKSENDKREAELNDLKAAHTALLAQHRGLENSGRKPITAGWSEMLRGIDATGEALVNLLAEPRPIPRLDPAMIDAVERRWVGNDSTPNDAGESSVNSALPSARCAAGPSSDLASLVALAAERDVAPLLWADRLWAQLTATNRARWHTVVAALVEKIESHAPGLRLRHGAVPATGHRVGQADLSRPRNRMIERLARGEAMDLSERKDPGNSAGETITLTQEEFEALLRSQGIDPALFAGSGPDEQR